MDSEGFHQGDKTVEANDDLASEEGSSFNFSQPEEQIDKQEQLIEEVDEEPGGSVTASRRSTRIRNGIKHQL